MKLIIMVGLPASGKTTLAEEYAEEFDCELIEYDKVIAPNKKETILSMIDGFLKDGKDVILDGLYVAKKRRTEPIEVGRSYDAEICLYMVDTPYEECIENNKKREHPIDEVFIRLADVLYEEPTEDEYDTLIRSEKK